MNEVHVRDLYLDTMANVLTRYDFEGSTTTLIPPAGSPAMDLWNSLCAEFPERSLRLVDSGVFDAKLRAEGKDWPAEAETMVGLRRLENIRTCVQSVLDENVPGDLIETGVWRGGVTIYMRAILAANGVSDRVVWVADSFQGLPEPDSRYPDDTDAQWHTYDALAVSEDEVRANFRRYGLLDDQVRFLAGWFEDTLPDTPIDKLAVLRLDGDMYGSTIQVLNALYDKVPSGGFVIVDDYASVPACAQAVTDFRSERGISEPIETIDWSGVFWRKT